MFLPELCVLSFSSLDYLIVCRNRPVFDCCFFWYFLGDWYLVKICLGCEEHLNMYGSFLLEKVSIFDCCSYRTFWYCVGQYMSTTQFLSLCEKQIHFKCFSFTFVHTGYFYNSYIFFIFFLLFMGLVQYFYDYHTSPKSPY